MTKEELRKIHIDLVNIMKDSKATFFVSDPETVINADDVLYELKAEMITNVEMYFVEKLQEIS